MARKNQSRTARWGAAVQDAREAYEELLAAAERASEALEALRGVQEEYQEWLDNLPENLQQSALGEKLAAVTEIDLDVAIDIADIESAIDEAENADLPLGFGRD